MIIAGEAGLMSAEALGLTHEVETGLNVLKQESKIASVVAKSEEAGSLCQDLEFVSNRVKLCDCSNAAYDLNQFEQLNEALKIKEFTSIIKTTRHGLQRLIEIGFTPAEVKDLIHAPDIVRTQLDNAKVFVKKLGKNKYNIMIYNQHTQEVITVLKSTTKNKLLQLGNNYGWIL